MDLIKINDVVEYLKTLKANLHDYVVVFAACDNIGRDMSEEIADLLIDLGLRDLNPHRGLNGKFQLAYIAVVDSGNVCYERLGNDNDTVIKYRYQDIDITSIKFNWETPLYSQILYNGYDYSSGRRGISIFTLDKDTNKPIDTVLIDCTDRTAVFSRPFTVKDIAEYEKFRKEYQGINLPKLALTIPQYPYAETVVIKCKNATDKNQDISALCAENGLNRFSVCGADCLTSSTLKIDSCGKCYIFSGIARYRDKFIIGHNDIGKHDIDIDNVKESVGCFSLAVFKDNNCIEFSADYFGSQILFYYKSDNITAVSTSYHLLLLTLKSYDEKLRLDEEKVIAAQSYFGAAFELGFTYEMDGGSNGIASG